MAVWCEPKLCEAPCRTPQHAVVLKAVAHHLQTGPVGLKLRDLFDRRPDVAMLPVGISQTHDLKSMLRIDHHTATISEAIRESDNLTCVAPRAQYLRQMTDIVADPVAARLNRNTQQGYFHISALFPIPMSSAMLFLSMALKRYRIMTATQLSHISEEDSQYAQEGTRRRLA